MAGLTLAAAPVLAELLHLTAGGAVWWLPLVLAPLTVTGVQLGILQGAERFRRLAALYVVAAAGKVGGGLVGVVVGDSVTATMAGTAIGSVLSVLVGHGMVRGLLSPAPGGSARAHLPELLHATHVLLVLFVLTNVDVLLARHYLPGPEAGRYAVGAVVAKGAFWLPAFIGVVALPALSDSVRRRRAAVRAIGAVTACGVAVTVFCAAFGDFVVLLRRRLGVRVAGARRLALRGSRVALRPGPAAAVLTAGGPGPPRPHRRLGGAGLPARAGARRPARLDDADRRLRAGRGDRARRHRRPRRGARAPPAAARRR